MTAEVREMMAPTNSLLRRLDQSHGCLSSTSGVVECFRWEGVRPFVISVKYRKDDH